MQALRAVSGGRGLLLVGRNHSLNAAEALA
jgi:hypothetical protein